MQRFPYSLAWILRSLWIYRDLVWQMTKRELVSRYRGSVLGLAWSFLNPVLMLAVYTFVFSVVFRPRWSGVREARAEFAVMVFSGMIAHGLFAECVNRAPGLILSNPNFVKKVVFPLEVLPWAIMGSALFHAAASLIVLLLFLPFAGISPHWTLIFVPAVLLPLVLLTIGLCWLLASLGVYLRDIVQTIGVITTILLFLSPVFYPVSPCRRRCASSSFESADFPDRAAQGRADLGKAPRLGSSGVRDGRLVGRDVGRLCILPEVAAGIRRRDLARNSSIAAVEAELRLHHFDRSSRPDSPSSRPGDVGVHAKLNVWRVQLTARRRPRPLAVSAECFRRERSMALATSLAAGPQGRPATVTAESTAMTCDVPIRLDRVGKCFQLYDRPQDRLKQAILPALSSAGRPRRVPPSQVSSRLLGAHRRLVRSETGRGGGHHRA
jgi:lipopolysaccharide transport system permease protein